MKEKRYTLQEEQPIPVGWHPANEEEFFNKLNEERTWSNADDFEKELTAKTRG